MKTLRARWLMTDEGWLPDATVEIDDNAMIVSVGSATPASVGPREADTHGKEPVDLLVPAMPNAHCHAFQHRIAGLTERASGNGDSFWTWRERMYEALDALDPKSLETAATALYRRMSALGYGAVAEFHYVHCLAGSAAIETADALLRAARSADLDMLLLPVLYRRGGFDDTPLSARQQRFGLSLDEYGKLLEALRSRTSRPPGDAPAQRVGIAPHSLRAVGADDLAQVLALRDAIVPGCPVHIHISEQLAEVESAHEHLGTTPIEWLCANAPVDAHWTLVHATHATDAELVTLAARDATICVCTTTEANLGDGQFDLQRWWALGGSLSIGSDSNVGLDPREELRWLEYQARLARRERSLLVTADNPHPGSALWRRAVAGGRRSLGQAAGIGRPGAPARLLAIACDDGEMSADEALDDLVFAQRATRLPRASERLGHA